MQPRTLAARLFLLTALWSVVAIAMIAFFVSQNYRATAERNLAERLTANLYNIMGTVSRDGDGKLTGLPDLRDARYQLFMSGYYWNVREVGKPANTLRSTSLAGGEIEIPNTTEFDASFQRRFAAVDDRGNTLIGIEAQAFLGEGDNLFSFVITADRSEVEQEVNAFVKWLLLMLAIFAVGFILASFLIVRIGLMPLRQATDRLADIREGKADKIDGSFPLEIQPLIDETNSLIRANNGIIERARTQVGNLAHSLKTPLAVLRNEALKARPAMREIIENQVSAMQGQVQIYLDRARIAARSGSVTSRTDGRPVLERLARAIGKLNPELDIAVDLGPGGVIFAGEAQDLEEMVGNLLENAAKFANARIRLSATTDSSKRLTISIEDDGPGMTLDQAAEAMKRGMRLDETKPGSGLGLSIVKDIASEYGGNIRLERASLGGLAARLHLPAA
jgi:signal transduction histidine kinase